MTRETGLSEWRARRGPESAVEMANPDDLPR